MKPYKDNNPHNQPDQKNLILAIVLSLLILGLFHFFYEKPRLEQLEREQARQAELAANAPADIDIQSPTEITKNAPAAQTAPKAIRLKIENNAVRGSINLVGARIDDLVLKDYAVELGGTERVTLLAPTGEKYPYYGQFGWLANSGVKVPDGQSVWRVKNPGDMTEQSPLILTWDNGQGLTFEQTITLDTHYLFTIKQSVRNTSGQSVALYPFGLVSRQGIPDDGHKIRYILHEGPIGYLDGELREVDYEDLADEGKVEFTDSNGWLGITDKYWLTALLPKAGEEYRTRFVHSKSGDTDVFQADIRGAAIEVANGQTIDNTVHFFAGAKKLDLIDQYEEQLGIEHFDLAIDFGWYYFITKPFFYALAFLGKTVGNFGIGILIFTVFIRILVFPLANKSYRSMAKMKTLTPEMQKIKERHSGDKQQLQKNIMELYQRENVNPFSGCLPILVQIPIFFALYKVLYVTIEMRHAPFFGWIHDLSQPDPTSIFNLFGLIPWDPPSILMIGAWPMIMCVTMYIQQRLNPPAADPIHRTMMSYFPIVITYVLAKFPAGLVVYWAWNNTLSVLQQYLIMRHMGIKVNFLKRPEHDDIVEAQMIMQKERKASIGKKKDKKKKK